MPTHIITTKLGMSHNCFDFIWRHFHVQYNTEHYQDDPEESDDELDDKEEDELHKQTLERVQRDEEHLHQDDLALDMSASNDDDDAVEDESFEVNDKGEDKGTEHPRKKEVWYYKLEAFINH
eukprot:13344773-Ditylum_brightwellii.AAC.1